jgi:hypothetical protein
VQEGITHKDEDTTDGERNIRSETGGHHKGALQQVQAQHKSEGCNNEPQSGGHN